MMLFLILFASGASALKLASVSTNRNQPEDVCRLIPKEGEHFPSGWLGLCCPRDDVEPPPAPPAVKLKVILAEPCSGSTTVGQIVEELHLRANLAIAHCNGHTEVLKDLMNGYDFDYSIALYQNYSITEDDLAAYLKVLMDANAAKGKSLILKDPANFVLYNPKVGDLVRANGKTSLYFRDNIIDLLLCRIRDGFVGFESQCPDAEVLGTCETCGQFRGRGVDENFTSNKVRLNTDKLLSSLYEMTGFKNGKARQREYLFSNNAQFLYDGEALEHKRAQRCDTDSQDDPSTVLKEMDDTAGYPKFENLLAYEWDPDAVERSVTEWQKFLRDMGSDIDINVIREYISERRTTYDAPASHATEIENFEEVKNVLSNCGLYYHEEWCSRIQMMLRG